MIQARLQENLRSWLQGPIAEAFIESSTRITGPRRSPSRGSPPAWWRPVVTPSACMRAPATTVRLTSRYDEKLRYRSTLRASEETCVGGSR